MAFIKKRSDGTWQATIYCGRDKNGKKINKYVTKHSEKEVKKAARELEQELEDGKLSNVVSQNGLRTGWKYTKINIAQVHMFCTWAI